METRMLAYFFSTHAVPGHQAMPENMANHPFVIGSGPSWIKRIKPPTPAIKNQTQANTWTISRPAFPRSIPGEAW